MKEIVVVVLTKVLMAFVVCITPSAYYRWFLQSEEDDDDVSAADDRLSLMAQTSKAVRVAVAILAIPPLSFNWTSTSNF